jgi:hypothetical protein
MVAGRRFWGHNEQRAAQHQARRRRDLGIEAVIEDCLGAGEAGGLGARVESGRQVDQEDDGEAEQAEGENDPPQPASSPVVQHGEGEDCGKQRHRDKQVGVRLSGGLGPDRRRRRRQAGVARLADLDGAIVDELGDDQERRGGEDGQADSSLWGEHGAGTGRGTLCPGGGTQQAAFKQGETAEDEYADRAQAPAEASGRDTCRSPEASDRRPGPLQLPVDRPVEPASRCKEPWDRTAQALSGFAWHCPYAAPRRCYHRASLRLLFCSSFRRAREGLFHAPMPATLAGRPRLHRFLSSPLQRQRLP